MFVCVCVCVCVCKIHAVYSSAIEKKSIYEGHLESKERFAIKKYLLITGKKKNMQVLSQTLIFVVPCIMLFIGEISPTRCNNCVFYSQLHNNRTTLLVTNLITT